MASAPLCFLDLFLTGGTYHAATCRYSSAQVRAQPLYLSRIERWTVTQALPHPLLGGILVTRQASITLSDVEVERQTAPTLPAILATENPQGRRARVRLYDPDTDTFGVTIEGVIAAIGQDLKTLEIAGEDRALLQTELPSRRVFDLFPSTDTAQSSSRDPRVIVPFGPMPRVDLSLVHASYLRLTAVMGGADVTKFAYYDLAHVPNSVVTTGDTLVYDVQWDQDDAFLGIDLRCTDGARLFSTAAADQNDLPADVRTALPTGAAAPNRKWYRREIPLSPYLTGKTISEYLVGGECNTAGTRTGRIAKAFILDAAGVIKVIIADENLPMVTATLFNRNDPASSMTIVFAPAWDWGPIRRGSAGTATVRAVYRDGRLLAPSEYQLINFYDVTLVRCGTDCRDFNGRRMRVQVDVDTAEFSRNPARVYEFLWSDPVDGLGQPVDAASFTTAAASYTAAGLIAVAGGLAGAQPAHQIFTDLSLRGEYFDRTSTGAIAMTVDTAAAHPLSAVALGQRDDTRRRNATIVRNTGLTRAATDQVKEVALLAYADPGLDGSPSWLLSARRTRAVGGKVETLEKPYIGSGSMADRVCGYLLKRLAQFDTDLELEVGSTAAALTLGARVAVSAPQYYLQNTALVVERIEQEANRFRLRVSGYDPTLFTYERGAVTVSPLVNAPIDYSLTPPDPPTAFSFVSASLGASSDGIQYSIERYQATLPPVNVSAMVLRAFRVGQAALFAEVTKVPIVPGAVNAIEIQLPVGGAFTLDLHAVNMANALDYRYSIAATLSSHLVGGDTIPPAAVTGLVLTAQPPRAIKARWHSLATTDLTLAYYLLQYDDTSSFSSPTVVHALTNEHVIGSLTPGTVYFVRVAGVDRSDNQGAFSATVSLTAPRAGTNDLDDRAITSIKIGLAEIKFANIGLAEIKSANIGLAEIKSANIGLAEVRDANIAALNAGKITTGILTVNPIANGATAIQVENSGKIILESHVGSPSVIAFTDGAGVEKIRITGDAGSNALVVRPSSDGGVGVTIGHTGTRLSTFTVMGTNTFVVNTTGVLSLTGSTGISLNAGANNVYILRPGFNHVIGAVGGSQMAKIAVYSGSNGAQLGFIPIYTA